MASALNMVFGDDEYLVASAARALVDSLVPAEERTFGLEIVEGRADNTEGALTALRQCRQAVETLGFFGAKKTVWLRDANFLHEGPASKSENVKSAVESFVGRVKAGLPQGHTLVISTGKIDKRSQLYRTFESAGEVKEFSIPDKAYQAAQQARKTLSDALKKFRLRMDETATRMFMERVGALTRNIMGEAEKLALYLGDRKEATADDVRAVTSSSRESAAWDLADAFGRRNLAGALTVLRQLLFQKESAIGLVMGLENRTRDLLLYRQALDAGWLSVSQKGESVFAEWRTVPAEVDKALSEYFGKDPRTTHPYRTGLLAAQAKRFTAGELKRCRRAVTRAHKDLVSSALPANMVLEFLLIRTLSPGPKARRQETAIR